MSEVQYIVTDVTYVELVALIGASGLEEGCYYRITDFATKHYIIDNDDVWLDGTNNPEIVTGVNETLIVLALNANTISHEATSELYPHDVIHYDWNPDNWKFDLAFSAHDEQVLAGLTGVIYFRHDTKNDNSLGYDFRNVKFRRWRLDATPNGFHTNYVGISSTAPGVSNAADYADYLTFNGIAGAYEEQVFSNHFRCIRDTTSYQYYIGSILGNNVFNLTNNYGWYEVFSNEFGSLVYNNTFGGWVSESKIFNNFFNNIVGEYFMDNDIKSFFRNNVIGDNFAGNVCNMDFQNCVVGSYVVANSFHGVTLYTNIGSYVRNNIFGVDYLYLTIPSATVTDKFSNNIIGCGIKGVSSSEYFILNNPKLVTPTNCNVILADGGNVKVMYINSSSEIVIENAYIP